MNRSITELILSTAKASHSAGQLEGRDEGRKAAEVESATIIQALPTWRKSCSPKPPRKAA